MSPVEILIAAKNLISDRNHWTQGSSGRTKTGRAVPAMDEDACRWCATGAVTKMFGYKTELEANYRRAREYLDTAALKHEAHATAIAVNDTKPHHVVMQMFDEAIEHAIAVEEMSK